MNINWTVMKAQNLEKKTFLLVMPVTFRIAKSLLIFKVHNMSLYSLFVCFRNISCFCRLLTFFKINFSKNSFRNKLRVSNSLHQDQAQQMSVLIWVQTVCIFNISRRQKLSLARKELIDISATTNSKKVLNKAPIINLHQSS